MRRLSAQSVLVVVAAAVLTLSAGAAVAFPTGLQETDTGLAYEPSVPDEYDFTSTERAGVAAVDGERYDRLAPALAAADPGDVVRLRGRFDPEGTLTLTTPNITLRGIGDRYPVVDGDAEGDVLELNASDVTVERVWVRNSGYATDDNDAAVWVAGDRATIRNTRVTDMTFGIWVDGARNVTIVDNTVVGRESITSLTDRGNGVQLWKADDAYVANNTITDVRDGIYYSWASGVLARNNTLWDLRYGVHYMYSDHCQLVSNTAFDNDVGFTLMVSEHLTLVDNVAVNNSGQSGHGIMVKSIDHTTISGNHLVENDKGMFVYNSLDNDITDNLVVGNDVGVHLSAGSIRERVHGNAFVRNGQSVRADVGAQVAWNDTDAGNYWSGANPSDVDDDGVGETRHRPAGLAENILAANPNTSLYANSPSVDVVRLAESTLPVVQSPGVVDHHPLTEPPTQWRHYYESNRSS